MTLIEDFNAAADSNLLSRIVAALSYPATDTLIALTGTEEDYKQKVLFIKACLNAGPGAVTHVARALISRGLDLSDDTVLQNAITGNFDTLATLYDPTLEA